jgi:hypothetical protein
VPRANRDVPGFARALLWIALIVWPLAAFGGRSAAVAIPYSVVCILLAAALSPALGGRIDRALAMLAAVVALQCLPLPGALVAIVSPHADDVRSALALGSAPRGMFATITIHATSTLWALAVTAAAIAVFWIAKDRFSRGGVRQFVRIVAGVGFAVSLLAIAQAATAGRRIYWRFPTEFEGPLPFGPFVNRNHFATWVVMALPLVLGYVAARTGTSHERPAHIARRSRLATAIDPRSAWLTAAGVAMAVALLLSLSRSGVLALAISATATAVLFRRRLDRRRRHGLLIASAIIVLAGLVWADLPALRGRFAGARTAMTERTVIWRETVPVVRDFWAVGAGVGTYQRAMYLYQQADRTVFFNQAHNHYLQAAAEGGVLLLASLAYALLGLIQTIRKRIAADTSGLVWIRIGAACGLGAVALQSVWETGLVMPANAALAAVLAAIAVHERRG